MILLAIYLICFVVFLLWWKSAHYRTPDEEARDIEEEAAYWRDWVSKSVDSFGKKDDTYFGQEKK